jgi:hypothetical protein
MACKGAWTEVQRSARDAVIFVLTLVASAVELSCVGRVGFEPTDARPASDSSADPCAACDFSTGVCIAGQCMPACTTNADCSAGDECVDFEGLRYCALATEYRLQALSLGGIQESRGGGMRLRGALVPWAGSATGDGYVCTPPLR